MDKIKLFNILLGKPEGYINTIKDYSSREMRKILGDAASQTEEGMRLLVKSGHRWLRVLSKNMDKDPIAICNGTSLVGIRYKDGSEIGDGYYHDRRLSYRIPFSFLIDESGIYKGWSIDTKKGMVKGKLITSNPVLPVGALIVANGRFQSFYRFRNIITGCEFVDDMSKLSFVAKTKMPVFKEYVHTCVLYNALQPASIKIVKFS